MRSSFFLGRTNWQYFLQGDKDFTPAAAQVAHQKPQPGVPKHPPIQHIKPQIHQPRKWAGAAGYHGNYSSTSRPSLLNGTHRTKTFPLQAQIFQFCFFLHQPVLRCAPARGNADPSNMLINTMNESNQPIATTSATSQRGAWAFFLPVSSADQKGNSTGHEADTHQ